MEMKKVVKKPFLPVRRAVKRGAPPIIKPRRALAQAVLDKARTRSLTTPREKPAPAEVAEQGEADFERVALADAAAEDGAEKPAVEAASNFLAMYFKEMARLSVLRPEEEFRQAKEIEALEIGLWTALFSFAPIVEHLLKVIERTLENSLPEFRVLRRAMNEAKKGTRAEKERIDRASLKIAERLRVLDIDRRLLEVVMDEVSRIAEGDAGRVVYERLPFAAKSTQFRRYRSDVLNASGKAQRAKNEFVKANLRLVVSIARRFNHGRMPLADLIQEGNIGLIKAVERFDYRRGFRFSTYASWWIRHAISRALADKGRAVRLPVHMIDAYHRVSKSKRELTAKLGRQPTSEEIGEATGIGAAKVEKMRTYLLDQSFSLDKPVSDEDGRRFIDFIQDPNAEVESPIETLSDAAVTHEVRDLLAGLKPIEAEILRQRFGLDDDKELTLKEIGEKYNLSRERIRQLQEQALTKMRRALQRKDMM
jgi:RNA polymerase primary sigma factor